MRVHVVRLAPEADLKSELERFTRAETLSAGFILTCVGSLSHARLRMPGAPDEAEAFLSLEEPLEIVSLAGTLSPEGLHLHVSLSRRDGGCIGGHLVTGCRVRTTAEVVIGEAEHLAFTRPVDARTGYRELRIEPARPPDPKAAS